MAEYEKVDLFEHTKWDPPIIYRYGTIPQSIAGFIFSAYLLDAKGGNRILTVPVTNLEDDSADGTTGKLQPLVTKAQNEAFRTAGTLPVWFELYIQPTAQDDPYIWMDIPVLYHEGGK